MPLRTTYLKLNKTNDGNPNSTRENVKNSLDPQGIGGVDCVIAVQEVSQVVLIRFNLAQRKSSVSWITPGNCAGYWKDPGAL